MFGHIISYKKTFVLILYTMLFMEAHTVSDICKICTCKSSLNIDCRNRQLTSVPQPIPTTVESLDLSQNRIERIESSFFRGLTDLWKLNLNNNNISSIEQGTFQQHKRLRYLDLSQNRIERIESSFFRGLTDLLNLNLNNNNISSIEQGTFQPLTRLSYLDLSQNRIEKIDSIFYQDLTNLWQLNLNNNNISSIEQGNFETPTRLRYLHLAQNKIEKIEREAFHNLNNLFRLDLSQNEIEKIERGIFDNLEKLWHLDLSQNKIKKIERVDFYNLKKLWHLYLSQNKIEEIERGFFHNLTNLITLDLSQNKIEQIESGVFHNLTNLITLDLSQNMIEKIGREVFNNLTKLAILDLSENKIENIERGAFHNLKISWSLDLSRNKIERIGRAIFHNVTNLMTLDLSQNKIEKIERGVFHNLTSINSLYLHNNIISSIEQESFQRLTRLGTLFLSGNKIEKIERGIFQDLTNLQKLYLDNNQIQIYDDGTFLFLPSIVLINIRNNSDMMCECHLPAFVNYTESVYNRTVDVNGDCQTDLGNVIPILKYSQCQNYSLFQGNLQCQTCSGLMCNDSDVTSCPGPEPVCRITLSMEGFVLKTNKSCSTYRQCVEAMRNNTLTCNEWTSGTSCVGCCAGNLCNKKDFIGWTKSYVFHLTFEKLEEYEILAENISKAIEHNLSTLMGAFNVEYCGFDGNTSLFVMYCTVHSKITKHELRHNISQVLHTSQALQDIGVQQSHMKLIDEMFCEESTTSTNEGTFFWPMTKAGTTTTIPCHANLATRHCSSKTMEGPELVSTQNMRAPKCPPFTGIWQEPDMSQCYNTEWITQRLKDIESQGIDKRNIDNISKEIFDISEKSVYFKEEDIVLAVDILEKMVPLISEVSVNITLNNILLSINSLLSIPEEVWAGAEQKNRSANRMLCIIETIGKKIPVEEQQVTVLYANLGIGVAKVNKENFNGLLCGVSYGTNETQASTLIQILLMKQRIEEQNQTSN